jgi:glyoxylase-like metal-dependent hydrolase (beta-lactamase superfamily II)
LTQVTAMQPAPIETLPGGIVRIDTEYQRPGLAACYLLESQGEAAFVDTGTSHSLPLLLQALEQRGLVREAVKYVIPTHVHLDHAGGAGALMRALPNAQLVVHPFGARHLIDPAKLIAGTIAVYGKAEFERLYGEIIPVAAERVIEAEDGLTLELGRRRLECLDTPGHARHHICIHDSQTNGFFSGDTFGLSYREFDTDSGAFLLPTTTPVQFDPDAWNATLDRLLSYRPKVIYLTHFGAVTGVEQLATQLREGLETFVEIALQANEEDRQAQIRTGLESWALEALQRRGCQLPQEQCLALLALDLELNSQGLEVWLRRREAHA